MLMFFNKQDDIINKLTGFLINCYNCNRYLHFNIINNEIKDKIPIFINDVD